MSHDAQATIFADESRQLVGIDQVAAALTSIAHSLCALNEKVQQLIHELERMN